MNYNQHIIYFLIFFCLCFKGSAQQNVNPYFQNFSKDLDLPDERINTIFQDSKGFMWFGSENRLFKFDGYGIKTFEIKGGIYNKFITNIFEDEEKRLWFETGSGEVIIVISDSLFFYKHNAKIIEHTIHPTTSLPRRIGKEVYFQNRATCNLSLMNESGDLELISDDLLDATTIIDSEKSNSIVWFPPCVRSDQIIYKAPQKKHSLKVLSKNIISSINILEENDIHIAKKLPTNEIIIFSNQKLFCLKENKLLWSTSFKVSPRQITIENSGTIWLSFALNLGVRRYQNLESLKNNEYQQFLDGVSIVYTFIDKKRGVWITTSENKVFYCSNPSLQIYNTKTDFLNNEVLTIDIKGEDELLVVLEGGGVGMLKSGIYNPLDTPIILTRNEDINYHNVSGVSKGILETKNFMKDYNKIPKYYPKNLTKKILKNILESESRIDPPKVLSDYFVDFSGNYWIGGYNGIYESYPEEVKRPITAP